MSRCEEGVNTGLESGRQAPDSPGSAGILRPPSYRAVLVCLRSELRSLPLTVHVRDPVVSFG